MNGLEFKVCKKIFVPDCWLLAALVTFFTMGVMAPSTAVTSGIAEADISAVKLKKHISFLAGDAL